jgi:hypothetical protein
MNQSPFKGRRLDGPMRVACHLCGFASESMIDALRHDACRPRSCERWRELTTATPRNYTPKEIETTLRYLTVQGGGNLELALDGYLQKIEPVYR